jgi:hypothetical protein
MGNLRFSDGSETISEHLSKLANQAPAEFDQLTHLVVAIQYEVNIIAGNV